MGKIIRTLGLFHNLDGINSIGQTFEQILTNKDALFEYVSYYSYDKPLLVDLKVRSVISIKGLEDIEILGQKKELLLIEENISSEQIGWQKTNQFWVNPKDFYVWKSIQYVSPKLPEFRIQVTKRPVD